MKRCFRPLLYVCCCIVTVFTACKKDKHDDGSGQFAGARIKTAFATGNNDTRTYTYDSKGRLTRMHMTLYGAHNYEYTDTSITLRMTDTSGKPNGTIVYKLGANGLVTNQHFGSFDYVYSYNTDKQPVLEISTVTANGVLVSKRETHYRYTNGNLDSTVWVEYYYEQGVVDTSTSTRAYYTEYYTDKPNTLDNEYFGQAWLGKKSKNLVKKYSELGLTSINTMTYEFDTQNRVVKDFVHWPNGATSKPIEYTWY